MSRRTEAWIMLPMNILLMVGSLFIWRFVELIPDNQILKESLSGGGFTYGLLLMMSSLMRFGDVSREKKRRSA